LAASAPLANKPAKTNMTAAPGASVPARTMIDRRFGQESRGNAKPNLLPGVHLRRPRSVLGVV
jgi:hypothetical protein